MRSAAAPLVAEAAWLGPLAALREGTLTLEGYRELLYRLYAFLSPMEALVQDKTAWRAWTGGTCVTRLQDLERDLHHLGLAAHNIRDISCPRLPGADTLEDCVGIAWVVEDSGPLYHGLARAVRRRHGLESAGTAFLGGADRVNLPAEHGLEAFLEQVSRHVDHEKAGNSARNCLAHLLDWLLGL
jgi:heme oxygenase